MYMIMYYIALGLKQHSDLDEDDTAAPSSAIEIQRTR